MAKFYMYSIPNCAAAQGYSRYFRLKSKALAALLSDLNTLAEQEPAYAGDTVEVWRIELAKMPKAKLLIACLNQKGFIAKREMVAELEVPRLEKKKMITALNDATGQLMAYARQNNLPVISEHKDGKLVYLKLGEPTNEKDVQKFRWAPKPGTPSNPEPVAEIAPRGKESDGSVSGPLIWEFHAAVEQYLNAVFLVGAYTSCRELYNASLLVFEASSELVYAYADYRAQTRGKWEERQAFDKLLESRALTMNDVKGIKKVLDEWQGIVEAAHLTAADRKASGHFEFYPEKFRSWDSYMLAVLGITNEAMFGPADVASQALFDAGLKSEDADVRLYFRRRAKAIASLNEIYNRITTGVSDE